MSDVEMYVDYQLPEGLEAGRAVVVTGLSSESSVKYNGVHGHITGQVPRPPAPQRAAAGAAAARPPPLLIASLAP